MLKLDIVAGPSKWELAVALFEGHATNRSGVFFQVSSPESHIKCMGRVRINALSRVHCSPVSGAEDEDWNFIGYWPTAQGDLAIRGIYNVRHGTGKIELCETSV